MSAAAGAGGQGRAKPHGVSPCPLCGSWAVVLYDGLRDTLCGAPGQWRLAGCSSRSCGLAFLDPVPDDRESVAAYERYYTHEEGTGEAEALESHGRTRNALHRLNRWLLRVTGAAAEKERVRLSYLSDVTPGRAVEVGCGSGWRLAELRRMGWDVVGQEVDAAAAARAREVHGLTVLTGPLEALGLAASSFDAVIANHVVEHVREPARLLAECWRILRPGGRLICVTPNVRGVGRRLFGRHWRGLEPPRHLHIFSPRALGLCARGAGLGGCRVWTTSANTFTFSRQSLSANRHGSAEAGSRAEVRGRVLAALVQHLATAAHAVFPSSGDECVLLAVK